MPTPKTVSADVAALMNAANKAAARTALEAAPALGADDNYVTDAEKAALHSHDNAEALAAVSGTNTGDEDTASILDKLKGAAEDPDRIGAEYMPEVISPDWIMLPNMAAYTIPDNSLGQKNGVFYFGNSPAFDNRQKVNASTAGGVKPVLATLNVPASLSVADTEIWVDMDFIYSTDIVAPGTDPGDVGICMDFLAGEADDLAQGVVIKLPQEVSYGRIRVIGLVKFFEDEGVVYLDYSQLDTFRGVVVEKFSASTGFNASTVKNQGALSGDMFIAGGVAADANTLRLRLVSYLGANTHEVGATLFGTCALSIM